MNLDEILIYINSNQISKLKSTIELHKYAYFVCDALGVNQQTYSTVTDANQYNPKGHDVHNKAKRKNKEIGNEDGRPEKVVEVARLSVPIQKKIVLLAAAFLGTPELICNPVNELETNFLAVINAVFEDNKLQYKSREISKITMSQRECAELWYTENAEDDYWEGVSIDTPYKLRMRLLAPLLGDTLYPVYNLEGDMVAFGRYYKVQTVNESGQCKDVEHFDLYTAERFYYMSKGDTDTEWVHQYQPNDQTLENGEVVKVKGFPNVLKKIPVVYYAQPATEWHDVQEMIDRLEKKISNHADTNDYFDSPIVKAKGTVTGFSDKGESGKVLEMAEGADVEYLTYDNLPASMKMEMDNLVEFIHTYTHTPNISFESVKGIFSGLSGTALNFIFMDAHLKASDKEEIFGQGVQRRINYLKSAVIVLDGKFKPAARLSIKPKYTYFLPADNSGDIDNIVKCVEAGILSVETAISLNPLVEDAINEQARIKKEAEAKPAPPPPAPPAE